MIFQSLLKLVQISSIEVRCFLLLCVVRFLQIWISLSHCFNVDKWHLNNHHPPLILHYSNSNHLNRSILNFHQSIHLATVLFIYRFINVDFNQPRSFTKYFLSHWTAFKSYLKQDFRVFATFSASFKNEYLIFYSLALLIVHHLSIKPHFLYLH